MRAQHVWIYSKTQVGGNHLSALRWEQETQSGKRPLALQSFLVKKIQSKLCCNSSAPHQRFKLFTIQKGLHTLNGHDHGGAVHRAYLREGMERWGQV